MATSIDDAIDTLTKQYDEVLRACHDAMAADVPQATRDALRESIAQHLGSPDTEE
jgi:hypothetical protein